MPLDGVDKSIIDGMKAPFTGGAGGDMLEAVEGGLYLLEVLEVIRRVLLCMLEAVVSFAC